VTISRHKPVHPLEKQASVDTPAPSLTISREYRQTPVPLPILKKPLLKEHPAVVLAPKKKHREVTEKDKELL
jgi:hypothetical protein